MHLNIALAASIVSSAFSVVNAAKPSLDKRAGGSIGSLLADHNPDTFFDEATAHDTPRHARPIFQSASSPSSHHKVKRHSKRASGTCKKKNSNSNSNSGNTGSTGEQAWSTIALARPDSTPTSSSSASQAKETNTENNKETISPITSGKDALGGAGLFSFVDTTCGKSGATQDVTKTSGPNGAMDWLNCGVYAGGWTPPDVKMKDILVMSLDEALEEENSPFKACQPYLSIFDKYAAEYDIPAIMIASIAMQESTCNKDASGDNGGAHGLMQITSDKCTSGISCSDPDYNVKTGTKYLRDRLDANNGNILMAMGEYNGWQKGLTIGSATAIKDTCCQCQNNINYHMQMLNGWLLNKNGYELGDWVMGC